MPASLHLCSPPCPVWCAPAVCSRVGLTHWALLLSGARRARRRLLDKVAELSACVLSQEPAEPQGSPHGPRFPCVKPTWLHFCPPVTLQCSLSGRAPFRSTGARTGTLPGACIRPEPSINSHIRADPVLCGSSLLSGVGPSSLRTGRISVSRWPLCRLEAEPLPPSCHAVSAPSGQALLKTQDSPPDILTGCHWAFCGPPLLLTSSSPWPALTHPRASPSQGLLHLPPARLQGHFGCENYTCFDQNQPRTSWCDISLSPECTQNLLEELHTSLS